MLVRCSDATTRTRAFAMQFFLQNLGLGIGGLVGGLIVDTSRASSFTMLFLIEAVMFLVLGAIAATVRMPRPTAVPKDAAADGSAARGGLRVLLSHRAMVQLCVLGFVVFFACYGQFESGLAAYGTEAAGIQPSTLGIALAANTAVIVVAQFVVLRLVERRKRSRVIASVGLIWAFAWIVAGYAGLGHGSQTMATAAMISTYALFGLGESMLSPTVAPLVADLAPESMVGQYNSAFALCKQLALAVGPAVGGPMGASLHGPYIVTFVLFSLGITVLALRLGRHLTPVQDQPSLAAVPSRVVAVSLPENASAAWAGRPSPPCTDRTVPRAPVRYCGRANSHQTALPPPGVRRLPQDVAIDATMEMPRPASSPGSARRRRGRWSSPSVTSMISLRSVRRSARRIGGVPCCRELATSSPAARTPSSHSSIGKRQDVSTPVAKARARGAASMPPSRSSEALWNSSAVAPVRAGCWTTSTATSSSCSAVMLRERIRRSQTTCGAPFAPDSARSSEATPSSMSSLRRSTRPSV